MASELTAAEVQEPVWAFFYLYFVVMFGVAFRMVYKSESKNKPEMMLAAFFLLTGNINQLLTFKIPGVSFFEIQPDRLLFLTFSFFIFRKVGLENQRILTDKNGTMPWFKLILCIYVFMAVTSQFYNVSLIGFADTIVNSIYLINVLVVMFAFQLMASKENLRIIGRCLIIGAIITSLVSIFQLVVDPTFLHIGDNRIAFGTTLRSNGIFTTEYYNSYYMITALSWVLVTVDNKFKKYGLMLLFLIGVICSFQRMSWLIFILVTFIYFIKIEQVRLLRLVLGGLSGLAGILLIALLFHQEIMNSSFVKERMSESIAPRLGYYTMVYENIGKNPVFGFGTSQNDIYYYAMLRVTHSRERATGEEGGIHNGYLENMYYFGVPASFFFGMFIFLAVIFFAKTAMRHIWFAIPFLISFLYLVGNLTNALMFSTYIALLLAIHLGLGVGTKKFLTDPSIELDQPI